MKSNFVSKSGVIATLLIMVIASPAFAGPWTVPGGSTDTFGGTLDFTYSNGGDVSGLFGDPLIFGNAFFFTTSFQVDTGLNGSPNQQSDTVSVDVLADPGLMFSGVSVSAFGSFAITTDGSVDFDASITMKENPGIGSLERTFGPQSVSAFESDNITPVNFPVTTPGSLLFNGTAAVNIESVFPTPHNNIHIELANNVLAISGPGGTAEINVTFSDISIVLNVIPEPTSLSLLATGGLLLIIRRRRSR